MYRIRFHGRGGQGMKTASRMLGNAFLLEGFEVQDAPRYGAERRGAPIFAYVRADRRPINERGIIRRPDLVVVADDTLVGVPAAGIMDGIAEGTVLLIDTPEAESVWRRRLNAPGPILALPPPASTGAEAQLLVGAACVGAAAQLVGAITEVNLESGIRQELAAARKETIENNVSAALAAYRSMSEHRGLAAEGAATSARSYAAPDWVELAVESGARAAPLIETPLTSMLVRTGLWRTLRPVIDYDRCNRCNWVCSSFCPDNAIHVREDGAPEIDYEHCKGCMICVVQCPPHAIDSVPEREAQEREREAAGR
jgi:pyruvate ferredoxin oxidoreductase gamma subunit